MKKIHMFCRIIHPVLLLTMLAGAATARAQEYSAPPGSRLSLFGGICKPAGDFAASTLLDQGHAGFAVVGIVAGVEYAVEVTPQVELGAGIAYSTNAMDEGALQSSMRESYGADMAVNAGPWSGIDLVGSAGVVVPLLPSLRIHGNVLGGLLIGMMPEVELSLSGRYSLQHPSTTTALEYGFMAGVTIRDRYDVGIRVLMAEPEFTTSSGIRTITVRQPMTRVSVTVGYIF